ncbi:polycomb protein Pcl [Contarinia nasturtii]|uniref:polycomb protein Pcl n=1 Tax=Contarinia nasturtii TaxID=265458 RepID=UPI0012D3CEBD|nr:polycomb protein Pcl [Contarinia nasturtii]
MPSSSKCSATNEPTAIVSEISKANNITIDDNGLKINTTKIPTYKFYGERSTIASSLQSKQQPKDDSINSEKLNCKQNVNSYNTLSEGKMSCRMNDIQVGDEVLVHFDGGNFYLGVIKEIRSDSLLARFASGTEKWAKPSEITKLNVKKDESMCVVCKKFDENVQVCSQCQRGFHKKCSKLSKSDESSTDWYCQKCSTSYADANESSSSQPIHTGRIVKAKTVQETCYCGEKGDWFMQMLQCARCLQWFHAKCTKCLNFPLYFGDRFYLFACARCNHGVEFLRRLHMNIEEVVHLLLFNLTLRFRKRYYSLTNVIYPYARDNWHALQLPPKLKNMMLSDVKEDIKKALGTHNDRFKPGNDVNQKILSWALVSRTPPKAPNIVLPQGPLLTEKYINDLFKEEAKINFMTQNIHNPSEVSFNDAKIKDAMAGKSVETHIKTTEDTSSDDMDSGAFSSTSDDDILANFNLKDAISIQTKNSNQDPETASVFTEKLSKGRKSSVPQLGQSEKSNDTSIDFNYSSDDTLSFTLDTIIPPPKNFSGINNPFLIDTNACHESRSFGINSNKTSTLFKCTNSENVVPSNVAQNKPKVQLVRTVKRRLSVNDIEMGPNKRRKLKKRLENVEVISTSTLSSLADLPKLAAYLPLSADSKRISIAALRSTLKEFPTKTKAIDKKRGTSLDSSLFGEQSNSTSASSQPDSQPITASSSLISSISSSPIKDTLKEESMADLQSSLNIYFGGVANRLGNGENFAIKGKRVLSDGRLQYLIEWDGIS